MEDKAKVKLEFVLEPEPKVGQPFNIYMQTEWLSTKGATLSSTAGFGGTKLFFTKNGKTYSADVVEMFKSLIDQL